MRLYHGNPDPNFVPVFGGGRSYHDYGNAFYCTQDFDSAAQWACLRKTVETADVKGRGDYDGLVAEARKLAKESKNRGTSILKLLE